MSGGVDSSVAAYLLKKQSYNIVGIFMRCYNVDGCAERDAEDARRVAEHLNIPFYVWDFEEEYKKRVVDYMIEGYKNGITPNPDVMCNKEIKFGLFFKKAFQMGAPACRPASPKLKRGEQAEIYMATGHYVRLLKEKNVLSRNPAANLAWPPDGSRGQIGEDKRGRRWSGRSGLRKEYFSLYQAKDKNKDQSYFLWTLTQEQLKHCLFPIGDYLKSEVREIARKAGLPTAEKKDSQGICFLGKVALPDFLKQYIPEKKGAVLTTTGQKIGEHNGAHFYTIGQRHLNANFQFPRLRLGLPDSVIKAGFGGQAISNFPKDGVKKDREPFYVAEKDTKTNTIVVAEGSDNPALCKKEIELTNVNFINPNPYSNVLKNIRIGPGKSIIHNSEFIIPVMVRVRYRQPLAKAILVGHRSSVISHKLIFEEPQKAVAPGQSAVFYFKNDSASVKTTADMEILGGGVIL